LGAKKPLAYRGKERERKREGSKLKEVWEKSLINHGKGRGCRKEVSSTRKGGRVEIQKGSMS